MVAYMKITRSFEIDYGHRLLKHESKCRSVHGHRGRFDVTCSATALDEVGRVIDFGVIKEKVGGWLNDTLDHGFIAERGDPLIEVLTSMSNKVCVLDCPPSIENLVRIVFERSREIMAAHGIDVVHVRGYETPTCWADYGDERLLIGGS